MRRHEVIENILAAAQGTHVLPRKLVLSWMRSRDVEVMALVEHLLGDRRFAERIRPPLQFEDYHKFLMRYLKQCILNDARGHEYILERWEAGYRLATYSWYLLDNPSLSREAIENLKQLIAHLYVEKPELRDFIVSSVLEHVLEHPQASKHFKQWQNHPLLREAYERAMAWATTIPVKDSMLHIHRQFLKVAGSEGSENKPTTPT